MLGFSVYVLYKGFYRGQWEDIWIFIVGLLVIFAIICFSYVRNLMFPQGYGGAGAGAGALAGNADAGRDIGSVAARGEPSRDIAALGE